jgi:hypothetical protein
MPKVHCGAMHGDALHCMYQVPEGVQRERDLRVVANTVQMRYRVLTAVQCTALPNCAGRGVASDDQLQGDGEGAAPAQQPSPPEVARHRGQGELPPKQSIMLLQNSQHQQRCHSN